MSIHQTRPWPAALATAVLLSLIATILLVMPVAEAETLHHRYRNRIERRPDQGRMDPGHRRNRLTTYG